MSNFISVSVVTTVKVFSLRVVVVRCHILNADHQQNISFSKKRGLLVTSLNSRFYDDKEKIESHTCSLLEAFLVENICEALMMQITSNYMSGSIISTCTYL